MRDRIDAILRKATHAMFRRFLPQVAVSVLSTALVSALFAQLAPERPALSPPIAPAPAAVPVERLWPREPDLAQVFSFSLGLAGRPFSAVAAAEAVSDAALSESRAPAVPAKAARAKPRPAPSAVAAAPMLPPVRPAAIETRAPIAAAAESAAAPEPKPVRLLGMTLPGWVPTGETVVNTATALGGAVLDRLSF